MLKPDDYVLVGAVAYPAQRYFDFVNDAFLEILGRTVPEDASPRRIARALRDLKSDSGREAIQNEVINRLAATEPLNLTEAVKAAGRPLAAFPKNP